MTASAGPYVKHLHLAPITLAPHHSIFISVTGRMFFMTPDSSKQKEKQKPTTNTSTAVN